MKEFSFRDVVFRGLDKVLEILEGAFDGEEALEIVGNFRSRVLDDSFEEKTFASYHSLTCVGVFR